MRGPEHQLQLVSHQRLRPPSKSSPPTPPKTEREVYRANPMNVCVKHSAHPYPIQHDPDPITAHTTSPGCARARALTCATVSSLRHTSHTFRSLAHL